MRPDKLRATRRFLLLALSLTMGGLLLLSACSDESREGERTDRQPTSSSPAVQSPTPPSSGKTPVAPSKPSLNVCSLLTRQEVEAVVGIKVLEPQSEEADWFASCSYKDPKEPDLDAVSVSIVIGQDVADAKLAYELGKKNAWQPKAVTGVGEDAYWHEIFNSLHILKGNYDISIEVTSDVVEEDDRLSIAKGLAAKMLGRLP